MRPQSTIHVWEYKCGMLKKFMIESLLYVLMFKRITHLHILSLLYYLIFWFWAAVLCSGLYKRGTRDKQSKHAIMWQWHNRFPFRGRKQRLILKLEHNHSSHLINQSTHHNRHSKWVTLLAGAQSNQTRYDLSNNRRNQLTDTCQGLFTSLIETLGVKDTQFEELISLDPDTIRSLG